MASREQNVGWHIKCSRIGHLRAPCSTLRGFHDFFDQNVCGSFDFFLPPVPCHDLDPPLTFRAKPARQSAEMPFFTLLRQKMRYRDIWVRKWSTWMEKKFLYHFFEGFVGCPAQESYNLSIKARTSFFLPILRQNILVSTCWINIAFELPAGISLLSACDTGRFYIGRFLMGRFLWFGIFWQYHNGQVFNGQVLLGIPGIIYQTFSLL